jgi:hypothetical protein
VLRVLTMIEDKLSKHYQAENLPVGHPVREAIDELRRLRAERDALRACGYESIAMYRRCRDERDALVAASGATHDCAVGHVAALHADAARYRWLAGRMVHVGHPAGSGWTLDEVLVSGDRDLDEVVDAMAKEQICGLAKNGQIQEGSR